MSKLKLNFFALLLGIISLALSSILLFDRIGHEKIAYVRSSELVYNYLGMQEAQRDYQQKATAWQANMDTLRSDLRVSLSKFQSEYTDLKKEDREMREKLLEQQEENLKNYTMAISDKAKEEDDKITQAVLNQINSFVEEYGKAQGYDIILGTTTSGNLLYGKKAMDITEEVLLALNKQYKGEQDKN